jgi:hypothetical protein
MSNEATLHIYYQLLASTRVPTLADVDKPEERLIEEAGDTLKDIAELLLEEFVNPQYSGQIEIYRSIPPDLLWEGTREQIPLKVLKSEFEPHLPRGMTVRYIG